MNKKSLSEKDICTKFVTPALEHSGWDIQNQIREEVYFTKGRILIRGKLVSRGKAKRADYILYYKPNIPIALIEVKDNNHSIGSGMQQGLEYAEMLDIPFVYSTNGDGFLEHNRTISKGTIETELTLEQFPAPDALWRKFCRANNIDDRVEEIIKQDYHVDINGKSPRYFQTVAINRAIEAIAKRQDRILLVMATGTGKTYTAFQLIWRLWKSRIKKRILFLADRNILIDQAKTNDFKPFGSAMTKITNRKVDKSYEIYLSLYQAVSGNEEEKDIYKQFSRDFFDLVIIDECHRGSAAENSAWREILEYFSSATHLGLTATPKETKDVSNIHYFGEPIYTYSLKQGIEDGFLAPYKVIRIDLDKDVQGWRPETGKVDKFGNVIEDRIYNQKDFDRTLVLDQRTQTVAKKVTQFLKATNRFDKTIVFCEDIDHAERMRQALVNENSAEVSENAKYIMRITGDNPEGKNELDNFIMPESRYPVIVTTSKLLTTGVDAQTCKLIVLDQNIQSMTEFKQIIGRGTRIHEEFDKFFFTIMDFRKVTELFADPDFDGPPEIIYEPKPDDPIVPSDEAPGEIPQGEPPIIEIDTPGEGGEKRFKYYVGDVPVYVVAERIQYYGKDGKLITESLKDYTKKAMRKEYSSLDKFLNVWTKADQKKAIINDLEEQGLLLGALQEHVGRDYDPFDLICHVAYDQPPLTRRERADNVKKRNYFTKYGEKARTVLNALLDKYADEGIEHIEDLNVLKVQPISEFGTAVELVNAFGGKEKFMQAIRELESELYRVA